jgi:ATPase subunit of ABC transporter with duplicated ATPase domains
MKLGYLSQTYSDNESKTVREELRDGLLEIYKLDKDIKGLEQKM